MDEARRAVRPPGGLTEIDAHINDRAFVEAALKVFDRWVADGKMASSPIIRNIAAVSIGVHGDDVLLDLEYTEDIAVDVDCNVVLTGDGEVVEIQGTAEGEPFSRSKLDAMVDLAAAGIADLVVIQNESRQPS